MRPRSLAKAATLATLLMLAVPPGSAAELVRLDDPAPYDLQVQGFELARSAT